MSSADKLEELNLSQDEIKRFTEAMHKPEFKELFFEYAQEISDPANRARYEAEITEMENERGMDIKFLNPDPGYVIKTTVDGKKKAFVNICKNENIGKPSSTKQKGDDGRVGLNWSLPHSFTPPREDLAKDGGRCVVYDFVIHPDTYRMAETNSRFKKMVNEMALDGIKKMFNVDVDTKNIRFPKMKYKGAPTASVLRSKRGEGMAPVKPDLEDSLSANFPYPYDDKTSEEKAKQLMADNQRLLEKERAAKSLKKEKPQLEEEFTVPKYLIKYRTDVDIQDFANNCNAKNSAHPKYLIVEVELPLLRSADSISLDVFEKQLKLVSHKPAKYKLDINFAYPVDENEGSAKFDKSKNKLVVTLPVLPGQAHSEFDFNEKDGQNAVKSDEIDGKTDSGNEEFELLTDQAENKKPMIEVISEQASEDPEHEFVSREDDTNSETIVKDLHDSASSRTIHDGYLYVLPEFQCKEDKNSVRFVFGAKKVKKESLASTVLQQNVMIVRMSSVGDGGFPVHYSCYLKFNDGCTIKASRCMLAINAAQDVTLLLVKGKNSQEPWRRFMVGIDAECLNEREIDSADEFDSPDLDADHSTTFSQSLRSESCALANGLLVENTREAGRISLDKVEDTLTEKQMTVAVVHGNEISISEANDLSANTCISQEINATADEDLEEHTSQVSTSYGPRLKKSVSFKDEAGEPNSVAKQGVISQVHTTKDKIQDLEECSVGQHLKQAMQQHNGDSGCDRVDFDISEHEGKLCYNGQESRDAEMSLHHQNCPVRKDSLAGISNRDDSTSSSSVEHKILENANSDQEASDKFISENISNDNIASDEAILNCISTDGAATGDALDKNNADEEEKQCQEFTPTAIPLTSECIEPSAPLKSNAVKTKLAAELTNKFVYDFDMD